MGMKTLSSLKLSGKVSVKGFILRHGGLAFRRADGTEVTIAKGVVMRAKPILGRRGGPFISGLGNPTSEGTGWGRGPRIKMATRGGNGGGRMGGLNGTEPTRRFFPTATDAVGGGNRRTGRTGSQFFWQWGKRSVSWRGARRHIRSGRRLAGKRDEGEAEVVMMLLGGQHETIISEAVAIKELI
jgi:hypothetical protein